jgi:recombinational DNA repair protein RecT
LTELRRSATIESIGSSTRIEGANQQVAKLLQNLSQSSFQNRDEQEVAGYAEVMELIFESWDVLPVIALRPKRRESPGKLQNASEPRFGF